MLGDQSVAGLIVVPGCAVRPLFRPFGKGAKMIHLTEARVSSKEPWQTITDPAGCIRLTAADIMTIKLFDEPRHFLDCRAFRPACGSLQPCQIVDFKDERELRSVLRIAQQVEHGGVLPEGVVVGGHATCRGGVP